MHVMRFCHMHAAIAAAKTLASGPTRQDVRLVSLSRAADCQWHRDGNAGS